MKGDLRQTLNRYHEWLLIHASPLVKQLKPGLTTEAIAAAVHKAGMPLPAEYFPLFELFDGQKSHVASLLPCAVPDCGGLKLASLEDMESWRDALGSDWLQQHMNVQRNISAGRGVGRTFWRSEWLPFAVGERATENSEAHSVYLVLDFSPENGGVSGQVFQNETATELNATGFPVNESVTRTVIAPSLNDFFLSVVDVLESGKAGYQRHKGIALL